MRLSTGKNYIMGVSQLSNPSTPTGGVSRLSNVYLLAMTALMTAVICVLAPISFPIGPIPLSLSVLAILLSVYLLGWKLGTVSVVVYVALGMVGAPVFAGYAGGLAKILGPTGGYIIGYIPMALIVGLFVQRFPSRWLHVAGMVLGVAALYTFGTAWYCIQSGTGIIPAILACVVPFIPAEAIKIIIVMLIGPVLRSRLQQAGLLRV